MKLLSARRPATSSDTKNRASETDAAFIACGSRQLIYRGLVLFVAAAGLMAALLAGGYRERSVHAQSPTPTPAPAPGPTPDYSNVDDILSGRRHLLRTDDLLVVTPTSSLYLNTADSKLTFNARSSNPFGEGFGTVVRYGRFFNFPYDTPVRADQPYEPKQIVVRIRNPGTGADAEAKILGAAIEPMELADFNGDGYSDAVLSYLYQNGQHGMRILTANDVNNFEASLKQGPEYLDTEYSLKAMGIGDFNGDGQPEIAGVSLKEKSVELYIYRVDPKTLAISQTSHITLDIPEAENSPIRHLSMAAGRFTAQLHDQLLVAYDSEQENVTAKVKVIDFDTNTLQPQERTTWDTQAWLGRNNSDNNLIVKTARLRWNSQYDQAVILVAPNQGSRTIRTLTIDPGDLTIKQTGSVNVGGDGQPYCISDITVGNFDRTRQNPSPPPATQRDPNLQVALLGSDCSTDVVVGVFDVDPQSFGISQTGDYYHIPPSNFPDGTFSPLHLAAGDFQGRSLVLGEPTKVVIDGTAQPTVIAAAPPMHADFMQAVGQTTADVINISTIPEGFYTTYDTESTTDNQSSSAGTTSWSFGARESAGASYQIGNPELGDYAKATDTIKAAQDLKGSTENAHGTYSRYNFNISQQTGFADQLWYTQTRFNIYVYPVIGQTVCPAGKPGCQEGEKVPLTIQFSGPDQTSTETVAASQVEWYQPPWEYGNILSYPGSYSQLQQIVPDINKLSNDLTFATDSSSATVKSTWASGSSDSQTTSFNQNYSFENDFSTEGAISAGVIKIAGEAEIDVSGSFGFSNLNKSSTTLGKSTGIGINKPGSFLDPNNYGYFFTPYIFGQKPADGATDNTPPPGDISTYGLLRTAFVVDPTRNDAGGWWKQVYTVAPDVALNHPSRWTISTPALSNPIPPNCRATGTGASQMNCVSLARSIPDDPWVSEFHHMRGFFISDARHPGQGPQLETAKAGDKLTLQTRVYNYSLAQMNQGAKVHARFYGSVWNSSNNSTIGSSFLIGEDVLDPIPPFSSDDGAPLNWVLAETTLDTAAYADKYLVFWVVVWTEENGKLAPEIADHGLTAIPGTLKSLADVQTESYSNNVGFYKFPFYVFAQPSGSGRAAASLTRNEAGDVRLGQVKVSERKIAQGQATEVSALLRTRKNSVSGVSVVFYDGDPAQGGKAFDVERVPYIRARDAHEVKVLFRSNDCGERRIFVTAGRGKPYEVTDSSRPVKVECAAPPACATICFRSPQYYLNNLWRGLPKGEVWIAGAAAAVSTRNIWALSQALKGGNSATKSFNREYVAAQLSMLGADPVGQRRREVLRSKLSCYGSTFTTIELSNGATIGAETTLAELMGQAEWAARAGRRTDLEKLASVFDLLNSDDPQGSCDTLAARRR